VFVEAAFREKVYLPWVEQRRERQNKRSRFLNEITGIIWSRR
jgi:hypothetical protein